MDNQNTNGLNNEVNNNVGINPNPTSPIGSELQSVNLSTPQTLGNMDTLENGVNFTPPLEPVPPVRPTLDSILNGTSNEVPQAENSISTNETIVNEPVVEAREVPIVDSMPTIAQNSSVISNINETPVVDPSASTKEVSSEPMQEVPPVQNGNVISPSIVSPVDSSVKSNEILTQTSHTEKVNESVNPGSVVPTINDAVLKENVQPKPLEEKVENSFVTSQNGLAESVDTLEVTGDSPQPTIESVPQNMDGFIAPQDDFSKVPVPPVLDDGKPKKQKKEKKIKEPKESTGSGGSKTIIFLLILVLIGAIGFGVYYFLSMTKEKATSISIVTKEVRLELGSNLSTDLTDYATVTGYDTNNCTLDLTNINIQKVSTYKFSVTCGKVTQDGTIIVDDTIAPKVVANDLVLLPNSSLKVEDFIESCEDSSNCTYRFSEDIEDKLSKIGEYDIQIIASDSYNNETVVNAKLTISRNAPVRYLTCVSKEQELESIPASMVHTYRIGITSNETFFNAVRTTKFTYHSLEDYRVMVSQYDTSLGINEVVGTEIFNESGKSVTIKASKTMEEMNKELNGRLPNDANIMYAYLSGLGYTCN